MAERRRPSSKPPPSEGNGRLVPRPTRDPSAGRYSLTSDVPPANPRKASAAPTTPSAPTRPGFSAVDPASTPPPPPPTPPTTPEPPTPNVVTLPRARELEEPPPSVPSLPKIPAAPILPRLGAMPLEDEAPIAPAKCAPLDELKKIAPTIETIASTTPVPRRPAPTRKTPKNEGDFDPSHDVDWQKLWLATQRASWRSLVVVPCGREVDALAVASALADVGSVHLSRDVSVIDATRVALGELRPRLADVAARIEAGETVLIAVRPVGDDPTARAFAENADAALLCVTLGTSSLTEAARAVEEIGRERFLGTAVLAPKGAG